MLLWWAAGLDLPLAISVRHPVAAGILLGLLDCRRLVGGGKERARRQAEAVEGIRTRSEWRVMIGKSMRTTVNQQSRTARTRLAAEDARS